MIREPVGVGARGTGLPARAPLVPDTDGWEGGLSLPPNLDTASAWRWFLGSQRPTIGIKSCAEVALEAILLPHGGWNELLSLSGIFQGPRGEQ